MEKSTKVSEQRITMVPMVERTAGSKEQQQDSQPGMKLPSRQELGIVNVRMKNRRYKKKSTLLKHTLIPPVASIKGIANTRR